MSLTWSGVLPFGEWKSQGLGARNCKAPTVSLQRCPPSGRDPVYLRSVQKTHLEEGVWVFLKLCHTEPAVQPGIQGEFVGTWKPRAAALWLLRACKYRRCGQSPR